MLRIIGENVRNTGIEIKKNNVRVPIEAPTALPW